MKILLVCTIFCLFNVGCALNTSAIAPPARPEFEVRPNLICAGETVHIRWDLRDADQRLENCARPHGGYDSRQVCISSADCPTDGSCIDGICVRSGINPSEVGGASGCLPHSALTVSANPPASPDPIVNEDTAKLGEQTTVVDTTTTFTADYAQVGPLYRTAISETVYVTPPEPSRPHILVFPFEGCSGAAYSWSPANLSAINVFPSDQIEIVNIVNSSHQRIMLSRNDPDVPDVPLEVGASTTAFNGVAKGVWMARPDPAPIMPPGGCGELSGATEPAPLAIIVELACASID